MIIQCPDCQTKMKPTVPATVPAGTKIGITCRCGTKLRFTYPGVPRNLQAEAILQERLTGLFDTEFVGDPEFSQAMKDLFRSVR